MPTLYKHPIFNKRRTKKHSNLGQTNPISALTSLVGAAGSGQNQLIIRTQIAPDITIDLNQLLSSDPTTSQNAVQGQGTILTLVKPEIIVNALGVQRSVAPYGIPSQNFGLIIGAAAVGLVILGGATAFWICRRI